MIATRSLAASSIFLGVLALAGDASAAFVAIAPSPARLDEAGAPVVKRSLAFTPDGINLQDCRTRQRIAFSLTLDQFEANAVLQPWAAPTGVDCADLTERAGEGARCWRVLDADVALQRETTITVPVRAILGKLIIPPTTDGSEECPALASATVDVQFLYFSPGNMSTPSAMARAAVPVDLAPPSVGGEITATAIAGGVSLSWPGSEQAAATVMCERLDATNTTCAGTQLVAGTMLDDAATAPFVCGRAVDQATTLPLGGLALDARYAFAVQKTDYFGNVGPLSPIACLQPAAVAPAEDDGGCTTSSRPGGGAAAALLLGGLALAAGARRRRR